MLSTRDISRIPVNKGVKSRLGWTRYSEPRPHFVMLANWSGMRERSCNIICFILNVISFYHNYNTTFFTGKTWTLPSKRTTARRFYFFSRPRLWFLWKNWVVKRQRTLSLEFLYIFWIPSVKIFFTIVILIYILHDRLNVFENSIENGFWVYY